MQDDLAFSKAIYKSAGTDRVTVAHIAANQSALELYHSLCEPDAAVPHTQKGKAVHDKARDAIMIVPPGYTVLDNAILGRLPQILEVGPLSVSSQYESF